MKTNKSIFAIFIFFINYSVFFAKYTNKPNENISEAKQWLAQTKNSTHFFENKGQIKGYNGVFAADVSFLLERGNTNIYLLKKGGIAWQINNTVFPEGYLELLTKVNNAKQNIQKLEEYQKKIKTESYRMDMYLDGANQNPVIITDGKSDDFVNFYNQNALDVHHYRKVIYKDVYPGIDWVIYTNEAGMKYDFILRPGANPALIKLKFTNHEELYLDSLGNLIQKNRLGYFKENAPVSFQEDKIIKTRFVLDATTLSFNIDSFDKTKPLIIDPSRIWATYYGGNGAEYAVGCATDLNGNVYLAGNTNTSYNIASSGFQNTYGGVRDLFLVKFNSSGVRQWATYYGDNGYEEGGSCATDASGNVYLAGATKSASNIASGGFQNTYSAGGLSATDAFLVKFNSAGVRQWATYYGGLDADYGNSCETDANGNIYLAGTTASTSNIAFGGYQNTTFGLGYKDVFLVKFNNAGIRQWATYYGGQADEGFGNCTTDANGNVYLAGTTQALSNIASGGFQNIFGGGLGDAFLVKFNSSGTRQWATYYGGTGDDGGSACATDAGGNVYLAGGTGSQSNIAFGGFQNIAGDGSDAFLVKFNNAGIRQWATYYGAIGSEAIRDCTIDGNGNVYLAGYTNTSSNISSGGFQNIFGGGLRDAFLVKFNSTGIRQWCSYYGDSDIDDAFMCSADGSGNVYLAGYTGSQSNIATGGYQNIYGGNFDAFLLKLDTCTSPNFSLTTNNVTCYNGNNGSCAINATGANLPFSYLWETNPTQITQTATNLSAGVYNVIVTNTVGCSSRATVTITQPAAPNYSIAFSAISTAGNAPFFAGFSNSTPNMANYNFTWYWGDGTFTSSNNVNVTHTFANPGFYDVSLVAASIANGCSDTLTKAGYMFIGGTAGCSQNVTLSPNSNVNSCSGNNVLLTATTNASAGFTYQWNINSVPISGATSSTLSVNQSGYYSCTVIQAGCPVTSVPVNVVMNVSPPQPVISTSGNILPCAGGTTTLTTSFLSGGTYSWSTGQTSQSIVVSTPGYYTVTSSYGNTSCSSSSAPFFLGTTLPSVPVCMVSVDSLSTHNIIIWEKTGLPSSVDSFRVYRETMTNVFTKIGSLSSNALSVFHDYNANPNVTSYKYKITAIDSCGSTSSLSNYHQTIHLQYFGLGNLQWTLYDIEAAGNPVNYYVLYRDNFNTGNFIAISSTIPGGNSTYTDINYASFPNARYKVETAWNISCTPTAKLNNTNSGMIARSNIIQLDTTTSVPQIALQNELLIYPNPASTEITISTPIKFSDVKIVNSMGQIVQETKYNNTISVVELSSGIYFVQLFNENGNLLKVKKFIKE